MRIHTSSPYAHSRDYIGRVFVGAFMYRQFKGLNAGFWMVMLMDRCFPENPTFRFVIDDFGTLQAVPAADE